MSSSSLFPVVESPSTFTFSPFRPQTMTSSSRLSMTPSSHFDVATACAVLPNLPLEVHHHILRLCDPPTLAITSLVSFAFLELSSPLLYNDVNITLGKQTEQLFCSRVSHALIRNLVLCPQQQHQQSSLFLHSPHKPPLPLYHEDFRYHPLRSPPMAGLGIAFIEGVVPDFPRGAEC